MAVDDAFSPDDYSDGGVDAECFGEALDSIPDTDMGDIPEEGYFDDIPEDTPIEEAPPVEDPPIEDAPPVEDPPIEDPPIEDAPPVEEPPIEDVPVVEDAPEDVYEDVPEDVFEDIPEDIPEDVPEDTPVEEPPVDDAPPEESPVDDIPPEEPPVDDTPPEEPPVDDTPPEEPPVDDTPTEEPPVDDTPPEEPPIDDTPPEEPPVDDTPPEEPPVDDTPPEEPPVDDTPPEEPPADDTPTEEPPMDDTPPEEPPADDTPTEEPPVDDTPPEEPPVDDTPPEEPPVDDTPSEEPPVDDTPTEEPPVDDTPTEEPPVDDTPTEEPPVDDTPTEEPPVGDMPTEEPPVDDTPPEEPPVDDAPPEEPPVDDPPPEEPPVDDTPPEEPPVDDTPPEEPPVDDTPTEEPPVDDTPPEEPPVDDAPPEEPPVDDIPPEEPPVDDTPPEEPPVDDTPPEEPPVDDTPPEEPPVDDTPPEEPPVDDTPQEEPRIDENSLEEPSDTNVSPDEKYRNNPDINAEDSNIDNSNEIFEDVPGVGLAKSNDDMDKEVFIPENTGDNSNAPNTVSEKSIEIPENTLEQCTENIKFDRTDIDAALEEYHKNLDQIAQDALNKMPETSDFNNNPSGDISNALDCYSSPPYGKDSPQYRAIQNHCHDDTLNPLRDDLFQKTELYNKQSKEVDRWNDLVNSQSSSLDPLSAQEMRNEQLRADFTLSMYEHDMNESARKLAEEAAKFGIDAETAQSKFVGLNGNSSFSSAYDGIITSEQNYGTCGVNFCASVENQQTGASVTQKAALTDFLDNNRCDDGSATKDIMDVGGTTWRQREDYLSSKGLNCDTRFADNVSLEDMAKRMEAGESVGLAIHAQDLHGADIDMTERHPTLRTNADGSVEVVMSGSRNHMTTVAGFDRKPDGSISTVYLNDTGAWNRAGNGQAVNRVPIPAEKYYTMVNSTEGMLVQFVSKK